MGRKFFSRLLVFVYFLSTVMIMIPVESFAINEDYYDSQLSSNHSIQMENINNRQILIKKKDAHFFNPENYGVKSVEISKRLKDKGYYLVRVPEHINYETKLQELASRPEIEHAEPDFLRESTYIPTDIYYPNQWYMDTIEMESAWTIERGSSDIVIAVIDSGVNADHPDLHNRVLQGYDFVNDNPYPFDDHGHGTYVAGLIAANPNSFGIVGIDHHAKILPIKVMRDDGKGSLMDVVDGIYYAIEQNVDIINMSYGTNERSEIEEAALQEAYERNIVLVAAAGNLNNNEPFYPAAYAPVISVASFGPDGKKADFSNYGNWIDITAPGINMLSTHFQGGYKYNHGTSFSAPIISGIASLLLAKNPEWTPNEIKWALQAGAQTSVREEWNSYEGFGKINAYETLMRDLPNLLDDVSDSWKNAEKLYSNSIVSQKVDLPMDEDWYQFFTNKKTEVQIQVSNIPAHLDLAVKLYQLINNSLVLLEEVDSFGMGASEYYSFSADPGNYYIHIVDQNNHWSDEPYTLKIQFGDGNQSIDETSGKIDDGSSKTSIFSDIENSWAKEEINYLASKNLINGFPDGTFRGTEKISRASAAAIIVRELQLPLKDSSFPDVPHSHWASKYIGAAVEAGILTGYPDGSFRPNAPLTRAEMAIIIVRAYDLLGSAQVAFSDVNPTEYSYPYIEILVANNITIGYPDNTFRPRTHITREAFATMLTRVLKEA